MLRNNTLNDSACSTRARLCETAIRTRTCRTHANGLACMLAHTHTCMQSYTARLVLCMCTCIFRGRDTHACGPRCTNNTCGPRQHNSSQTCVHPRAHVGSAVTACNHLHAGVHPCMPACIHACRHISARAHTHCACGHMYARLYMWKCTQKSNARIRVTVTMHDGVDALHTHIFM